MINRDYEAKSIALLNDYNANCKALDDKERAKHKGFLTDDYWARYKALKDDYKAKLKVLV